MKYGQKKQTNQILQSLAELPQRPSEAVTAAHNFRPAFHEPLAKDVGDFQNPFGKSANFAGQQTFETAGQGRNAAHVVRPSFVSPSA